MGEKIEIFLSYAHKDKALLRQLEKHLTLLKQRDDIAIWHARDISAGAEWQQAIDEHLNKAHLILLLISPDFMDSDNCYSKEMKRAVERHNAGEARIIPILLRPVDWQKAPFGRLQALPRDAQPITSARNRDHAFLEVAREIHKTVEEWSAQSTTNLQEAEKKEATPRSEMDVRQTLASATLLETEQRASGEETSGRQGDEEETLFEGRKAALIVGVNNTQRSSLLPDLKYAEDDAYEIASTLRTSACNFVCLQTAITGEKAETQAVRRAVIKLTQQKSAQDLLLFYFLGYALPIKTREGRADISLVTHDFDEEEAIEDATAYLSLRWLREKLYRPDSAARVLIILDCCYAEKMIHVRSDHSSIDISQLLQECAGPSSVMEQNGRWKVMLTASAYTTQVQEREMTSLLLAVLRGDVQKVLDHQGNVYVHTLYTYLQDELPLAQLPNLPEGFPQSYIIATHHEKSRSYLQQLQQAEEDARWKTVTKIEDEVKIIKDVITDSEYFKSLASFNAPFRAQWFDRMRDETASLLDLNQEKISKFFTISRVQIQDDFSSGTSDVDQLEQFGLLQESYPTYGALLCFGLNPTRWQAGAFTRCTLWSTNDRHNGWLEAQDYQRDLITQFELSRDFLQKHLRLIRAIGRDERLEELEIPLVALGEALANALVHREYANQASPVYVDIFYDRIEICSPGGPPEPMTMELLEEEHKSHPRNPQIARIFYLYGYVEKVGSGIQRMQNALQRARLRAATFELGKDKTFKVIFYRPQQIAKEVISSISALSEKTSPTRIFSFCAPEDMALLTQWETHLRPLVQAGLISVWSELYLAPGPDRVQELQQHLDHADVVVLLLSANFFASPGCFVLMEQALYRSSADTTRVIPLLLRPVAWQEKTLAKLTPWPSNGKPITLWDDRDAAWESCVQELRRLLGLRMSEALQSERSVKQTDSDWQRMLHRLQRFYKELLDQSLHGIAWMELGLSARSDMVRNVTNLLFLLPQGGERLLTPGTSIVNAYDEAEGELLILGAPGAGKSTLLLGLALQLVNRVRADPGHPLPVILRLSSWALRRPALDTWMIEQLSQTYGIPRQLSERWVTDGRVLPLLDGLDEMEEAARHACIAAINTYHRTHLIPLVVCSRQAEYEAATTRQRLALQSAVIVQPLSDEQIEGYLQISGPSFAGVRAALSQQQALRELATTPLMLSVLLLTYRGVAAEEIGLQGAELERQVWADYVARQVTEKGDNFRYPLERTRAWLSWLAQQMRTHQQTIFHVEYLHTDWLSSNQGRMVTWLTTRIPALVLGALTSILVFLFIVGDSNLVSLLQIGLLGGFVGGSLGQQVVVEPTHAPSRLSNGKMVYRSLAVLLGAFFAASYGIGQGPQYSLANWMRDSIILGLGSGLSFWIFQKLLRRRSSIPGKKASTRPSWRRNLTVWFTSMATPSIWQAATALGAGIGLSYGLSIGSNSGLSHGLSYGLSYGLSIGVMVVLARVILASSTEPLRFVERIQWNWHDLLQPQHLRTSLSIAGVLFVINGLSHGLSYDLGQGLINGLSHGLSVGLSYLLLLGLYQGMKQEHLEDHDRSQFNQGIRRSLRNGLLLSLISAMVISTVGVLSAGLSVGLSAGLSYSWIITISGFLLMWAMSGGLTILRHYVIRWLLARSRCFPWQAQAFLDDATIRILLRRVGGGYSFIHRRFQDYLVSSKEIPPS